MGLASLFELALIILYLWTHSCWPSWPCPLSPVWPGAAPWIPSKILLNLIQPHHSNYCADLYFSVCVFMWMGSQGTSVQTVSPPAPLAPAPFAWSFLDLLGQAKAPNKGSYTQTYSCVTEGSGMHSMCVWGRDYEEQWVRQSEELFFHSCMCRLLNYSFLGERVDIWVCPFFAIIVSSCHSSIWALCQLDVILTRTHFILIFF